MPSIGSVEDVVTEEFENAHPDDIADDIIDEGTNYSWGLP